MSYNTQHVQCTCKGTHTTNIWNNTKIITWNYSSPLILPSLWKMLKEAEHQCSLQWDLLHSEQPQHFQISLYLCSAITMQIKDNSVRWHFLCSIDMPHRRQHAKQLILTLKLATWKYHQCRAPKNQAGVGKKLYQVFSHQNILPSRTKSWNMIHGAISSAGSMLTTPMWLKTDVVIMHSMTLMIYNRGISPPILKLHPTWMLVVNFIPLFTPHISTTLCDTHGTGSWVGPSLVILVERKIFCPWQALNPIPSSP